MSGDLIAVAFIAICCAVFAILGCWDDWRRP
jgi:hypothetical protein